MELPGRPFIPKVTEISIKGDNLVDGAGIVKFILERFDNETGDKDGIYKTFTVSISELPLETFNLEVVTQFVEGKLAEILTAEAEKRAALKTKELAGTAEPEEEDPAE